MIMKKCFLKLLSTVLCLILIFGVTAVAAGENSADGEAAIHSAEPIVLSLRAGEVNSDGSVGLSLYMTAPGGVEIGGLQADIVFDGKNFTSTSDSDGDGRITAAILDFSDTEEEQLLCSYSLLANADIVSGYYTASLQNVLLYDTNGNDLDFTVQNARFAVKGAEPEYSVTLTEKTMSLAKGASRKLTYTTSPENALKKEVSWSSANERVAAVSADGTVTAVSPGRTNIIVSYGKSSDICTVTVFETRSSKIMFERRPIKTFYYVGEKLSTVGMKLRIFTDSVNSTVVNSGWTTECDEFKAPGTYSVSVNYSGYSITYNVEVAERPEGVDPLTPFALPKKYVFKKRELIGGRWPDLTGLAFWTESSGRVSFNRYNAEFSSSSELHIGKNTATVKLGGYSFDFDFYYIEDDAPDSIEVVTAPAYSVRFGSFSSEISTFGLGVVKINGDAETKIPVSELTFPERQFVTEGENIFEINYKGLAAYCLVNVAEPNINLLNGITIVSPPQKTEYIKGETVSFEGLSVAATYNGAVLGTVEDYTLNYDKDFKTGSNTVTVEYRGYSAEFTVSILSPFPSAITSDVYKIKNGILSGVNSGVTVAEMLENINSSEYLSVSDASGNPITDKNTTVCTGYKINLVNPESGKTADTLTVAVRGDINGDGKVSEADEKAVFEYLLKNTVFDDLTAAAADLNGDGAVTITDLLNISEILKQK